MPDSFRPPQLIRSSQGLAGPPGRSTQFNLVGAVTLPPDLVPVNVNTSPALYDGELMFVLVRGAGCWLTKAGGTATLRRHLPVQDAADLVVGETLVAKNFDYDSFPLAATVIIPPGSAGGTVDIVLPAAIMPTQGSIFKVQIKGVTGRLQKIAGPTAFTFTPDAALPEQLNLVSRIDFFVLTASTIVSISPTTIPSWLPPGANLHVDFIKQQFYWGGQVRTLADLVAHPNSGYTLNYGDWWDATDGAIIAIDVDNGELLAAPSGFVWSSLSASGQRIDVSPQAIGPTPSGLIRTGMGGYTSAVSPANYLAFPGVNYRGRGINRYCLAIKNGQPGMYLVNNGEVTPIAVGNWSVEAPTRMAFGNYAQPGQNIPLANATLRKVTIYKGQYSQSLLEAAGARGDVPAIHAVGDEFLVNDFFLEELMLLINQVYGYVPVSSDYATGRTLAQQAALCAAYSGTKNKWRNSWIVISDGVSTDTWQASLSSIARIAGCLSQKWRYMYMEASSPDITNGPGDSGWDAWYLSMQRLSNRLGSRFVSTHTPAMARANSSTTDQTQIDKLLWPVSLCASSTDSRPSEVLGNKMLAEEAFQALRRLRWFDGTNS